MSCQPSEGQLESFVTPAIHTCSVNSVAFSSDGQWIVSGSEDKTIYVWSATTGEVVAGPITGHTHGITSVDFSPDGQQIVSGSYDKTVCVWNAMTREIVAGPFTGHIGPVNSVVFSPDGQCIISGSSDQTIHMWSLNSSRRNTMAGHTCSVKPVEFPSDGKHIVSSEDKSIDMLNSVTERLITTTQVNFTDQSVIDDDGWICGNKGELLMWIPHLHRPCLQRPSNIWIVGNHKTHLDLSNFVHGHSWMRCIKS